jgi:hypothetical protein
MFDPPNSGRNEIPASCDAIESSKEKIPPAVALRSNCGDDALRTPDDAKLRLRP